MTGSASSRARWTALAVIAALGLAGCDRLAAALGMSPSLDSATQQVAAAKLAKAFAEVCLSARDAESATSALQSRGWPRFTTVWKRPDSVFYAAKPSPAGLFINGDHRLAGQSTYSLTCTGHYQADGAGPMLAAMRTRWGEDHDGPSIYPGSRAWAFLLEAGALTALPGHGAPTAAQQAALRAGQALVYAQVSYQPAQHDVASMMAIIRPAASAGSAVAN